MASYEYLPVIGFIQFDPNEREANGQTVRDVLVTRGDGKKVRITVWPEFAGVKLEKGMLLAADGKFSKSNVNGKEYLNLSATNLVAFPSASKAERGVSNPVEDDDAGIF